MTDAGFAEMYVRTAPSPQAALDIFKGEWRSKLPPPLEGCAAGPAEVFDDPRVHWGIETLGGVKGRSVLELGPMEGGHTYMLERAGAASVVAIEANTHAYIKCLIVRELLGLERARFLCGDFLEYLRQRPGRFDVCFASGVLYHVANPVELIEKIAAITDGVFLWTHYYDPAIMDSNPGWIGRFDTGRLSEYAGFRHTRYRHSYLGAHAVPGFSGGAGLTSVWLPRGDILGSLRYFGLSKISINFDDPHHPNGPSLAIVARRI